MDLYIFLAMQMLTICLKILVFYTPRFPGNDISLGPTAHKTALHIVYGPMTYAFDSDPEDQFWPL